MILHTMPDLRQVVIDALARREWSTYQLVQALKGKRPEGKDVPPPTIYQFLAGASKLNHEDLGLIFDALELSVTPPSPTKPARKKGK